MLVLLFYIINNPHPDTCSLLKNHDTREFTSTKKFIKDTDGEFLLRYRICLLVWSFYLLLFTIFICAI
jgi:hypothetical protein